MQAYRLGNYAFVLDGQRNLVIKAEFDSPEAARKAVQQFNAGKHETIPNW